MWSDEDKRRVGDVLTRMVAYRHGEEGSSIVFDAIKDMLDIERRMQSSSGGHKRYSSMSWIGWTHSPEEAAEIFKQRMLDVAAGEPIDKVFGFKIEAAPDDILTMEAVTRVFRSCMIGNNVDRDWQILRYLGAFDMNASDLLRRRGAKTSIKSISKLMKVSVQTLKDRKDVQCAVIWSKVKHLVRPLTSSKTWEVAA